MERPVSIVWFERCYLGALIVGLLNTALSWNTALQKMAEAPNAAALGPNFGLYTLLIGTLLGIGISLLLWYFTARRGSVVTKWIITVFFVLGVLGLLSTVAMGTFPTGLMAVVSIVAWVLNAIAVYQLFKPDTEVWFGEKKPDQGGNGL